MKKGILVFGIVCMLCICMSGAAVSKETKVSHESVNATVESNSNTWENIGEIIEKYSNYNNDNTLETVTKNEPYCPPQPLLGGNEIFGLWINIVYNGQSYQQRVNLNPQIIRGKLTDPNYRTPIKFNIDGDDQDDIETGFGFFRYGIDEILPDGSTTNHPAWATAFDFMQINNMVDDQLGELEIWQEFHINLNLIKSKSRDSSSASNVNPRILGSFKPGFLLRQLLDRLNNLKARFSPLQNLLEKLFNRLQNDEKNEPDNDIEPLGASEDYFVMRVGYRSPEGQKIPIRFEKKFAVGRDNIFRPLIFQKEMDPNDIIGTATNDVMFGFQAFREGRSTPSYDVEFAVNFDPAVFTVTQFIPRSGKVVYYYHGVGVGDPLDITFSSNILKGGDSSEEKEGTFSLTLTLDTPKAVEGAGRWMSFDPTIIGDWDILGGEFVYAASHKFDIGVTVKSPLFEEKMEIIGLPKSAKLSWDVDVDIELGDMFKFGADGYVELAMSSQLDNIVIYYPKVEPDDPDITFINVDNIPSREKVGAEATLYVDPNNLLNPSNYLYGRVYREFSANLDSVAAYLPDPDIEAPIIEITDIPAYSGAEAKLYWGKLQGYARAERYSAGQPDPIHFNLAIDSYTISDVLQIREGHIQVDFKVATDGYFGFDTSHSMFGNEFSISDGSIGGNGFSISVDEVSADDLWVAWDVKTVGGQIKLNSLEFSGFLDTLKGFDISLTLASKNLHFDGDWSLGEEGNFEVDFYQDEDIYLDFDLAEDNPDWDLNGYVIIDNDLHFDISWKWKQGEWGDPAYFKINENTNEANLKEVNLYFTYKDKWGADVTLYNAGIYVCVEWYWQNGKLYIWPVIKIYGRLDLHLLLNGDWYYNIEDYWP